MRNQLRLFFRLLLVVTPLSCAAHARVVKVDFSRPPEKPWALDNRSATVVTEAGKTILRLDERPGGGMTWQPELQLTDGEIDVDLRGRDILQKSFIGIAFHVESANVFDAVWLRPFNFQAADSARHAHAVQFASYPDFGWQVLREKHPGGFEAAVPADFRPDAWVHLRVVIRGSRVSVYLNRAAAPILSVENPAHRSTGAVGLWVGDNSPGDFANLVVRPASTPPPRTETYGFIARLGIDTISVERVTRTSSQLISDEVERFPRVIQRHTEIEFGPDQRVRRLTMDITLPTARTPKWKLRHLSTEYFPDSVRLSIQNGEGSHAVTLPSGGKPMLPWTAQLYSLTELYFQTALRMPGDSIEVQHFYVDMQADDYPLPPGLHPAGFVRALPGNRAEIFHHDGLAGAGEARFDAERRMLSYSGARSTYKMEVARLSSPPDIESIAHKFIDKETREGVPADLSTRDTARARIGAAQFWVDYGRPLARGRTLVGNVLPFGQVWRTGANAATQFNTSLPITLAGLELAAGTYTFWTLPDSGGVRLIVNRQFGQWGTQYDASRDLGRVPLTIEKNPTVIERFTISVIPVDAHRGTLVLEWGNFRWSAPIATKQD